MVSLPHLDRHELNRMINTWEDRKVVDIVRATDVFDALGLSDLRDTPAATVNGTVVARMETIQQVGLNDAADFQRLLGEYPRMALVPCYCSMLGECWLLDERERRPEYRCGRVATFPDSTLA